MIQGEATAWRIVAFPASLMSDPHQNGRLLLQPIVQGCKGELALTPVSHRGREQEGAAEEPDQKAAARPLGPLVASLIVLGGGWAEEITHGGSSCQAVRIIARAA